MNYNKQEEISDSLEVIINVSLPEFSDFQRNPPRFGSKLAKRFVELRNKSSFLSAFLLFNFDLKLAERVVNMQKKAV